jgi:MerR family mercuric resistance operon transcriptional regulator
LCGEVRAIAARRLEQVRNRIADLVKLERLLADTIAQCSGAPVPDCPVIDVVESHRLPA